MWFQESHFLSVITFLLLLGGGQRPSHFPCAAFRNQALMANTLKKTFRVFCYLFSTKCAQKFVWDTNTDLETSEYLVLSWPTFHSIRTSLDTVHNWHQFVGLNDSPVHKCLPTSIEHSFIFSNQFLKMFNI